MLGKERTGLVGKKGHRPWCLEAYQRQSVVCAWRGGHKRRANEPGSKREMYIKSMQQGKNESIRIEVKREKVIPMHACAAWGDVSHNLPMGLTACIIPAKLVL